MDIKKFSIPETLKMYTISPFLSAIASTADGTAATVNQIGTTGGLLKAAPSLSTYLPSAQQCFSAKDCIERSLHS